MTNKPSNQKLQKILTETQQLLDKCVNPDNLDVEIRANYLIQALTELLTHRKLVAWIKTDLSGELAHDDDLTDEAKDSGRWAPLYTSSALFQPEPITPTTPGLYAIQYCNNWDGQHDTYYVFAQLDAKGSWISEESGNELLQYEGDEILKAWLLEAK